MELTGHLAGHGAAAHGLGGGDDVPPGDVAVVLDVLDFLAVTGRLLLMFCGVWLFEVRIRNKFEKGEKGKSQNKEQKIIGRRQLNLQQK